MKTDYTDTSLAPPIRERQKSMLYSFAVELSSFGLNLVGALMANSLTLWTNTLRVGLDTAATFFAYSVTRRIARGKSHQFDYGLGKWENLSAFFNAAVMLAALVFIVYRAVERFLDPKPVTGTGFGIAVLFFFTAVNFWLLARFWRLRRADPSPVVEAQFVLYRNATAASLISLAAVLVSSVAGNYRWMVWFDPAGAVVLCGVIFYGMMTLFRQSLPALLDKTLDESLQFRILRGLSECFEDYHQLHGLRTRRSGNRIFVELFLEFDPELRVSEMLACGDRLKSFVEDLIPHAEVLVIPCGCSEVRGPPQK